MITVIQTSQYGKMAILPYQAEAPIKETWAFLTDVMLSHNGSETRIPLRRFPRRSLNYSIPLQPNFVPSAFNALYGSLRRPWAVPLWAEAQAVTVEQGSSFVLCNTELYDLQEQTLVMLWSSCNTWRVFTITEVTESGVELDSIPNEFKRCALLPVRKGHVEMNPSYETGGHGAKVNMEFILEELPFVEAEAPAQYEGADIYFDAWILEGETSAKSFEKRVEVADFALGPTTYRSPWLNSRIGVPFRTITADRLEVAAFKNWLFRRAGKYRSFWLPTFEQNIHILSTGTVTTSLAIENDSFTDHGTRRHLAFLVNGDWKVRRVESVGQQSGNTLLLNLSESLNVAARDIKWACFIGLNRLNSDRIEFSWIGNGVTDSTVQIIEVSP